MKNIIFIKLLKAQTILNYFKSNSNFKFKIKILSVPLWERGRIEEEVFRIIKYFEKKLI